MSETILRNSKAPLVVTEAIERARANPGVWVFVVKKRYPYSDRRVSGLDFERKYVGNQTREIDFWIRYRGPRPFPALTAFLAKC